MEFDAAFTDAWVRRFAAVVASTEERLTDLDQRTGDGDFGVNLRAGLESALARLARRDPADRSARGPLDAAATAFLDDVGGTSGPLFGLLLTELAGAAADHGDVLTVRALADGTAAGLAAIQRVGDAEPGDKTLVDALAPAARALREAPAKTRPDVALAAAADAAWEGVRGTALFRARRGRASYLGDRASGIPDPGAVGVGLLFSAAVDITSLSLDDLLGGAEPASPAV
ncbi:dihydroxyacetone kinase subunit DhaL [Streptomyces sp. SL13]|jgi:dihydroxyacetone kinase-like protein|uniref:Dihydroxyacetone kinase subunit DhaL n=1 Tax=Streptantibioticus silvisoli TaxID=2705255 RepID=A0AA90KF96_9ACTN|nr:dihydroxyacetone kinase subunit DhaL [Streptantibioticus silvisoli]MDI5966235.1 dihydroxyacetone kinase subunit DhaL [Streptantibioticus silvisoli]MDI5968985.1 dihydroxyacetone kinase subunit DhaL [Streptantibioticus silvisoli]